MDDHNLENLEKFIRRFVILPHETDYALATLWVAHTYFTDQIKTTMRLAIISPEYGCGKSRFLEVLEALCYKGKKLDHFTRSYLMRTVDITRKETGKPPTLLVDELDTKWGSKSEEADALRAFTNTGYRDAGVYGITEGEGNNRKPTDFKTFAPMALAGKGEIIPESVKQRGVIIRLQKRSGTQYIEDFLNETVSIEAEEVREGLVQWSDQNKGSIAFLKPEVPVTDRSREVWLPLFLVAELAGQEWIAKALESLSHHQSVTSSDPVSRERQLLIDIRKVWNGTEEKMRSKDIVSNLCNLPESEWSFYSYGKPISEKGMAKKLRPYEITPKNLRFGSETFKGYLLYEVEKALANYAPVPIEGATEATSATEEEFALLDVAEVSGVTALQMGAD